MCAYLSKTDDECSHVMTQAVEETWENKSTNQVQVKLIAQARVKCTRSSASHNARIVVR